MQFFIPPLSLWELVLYEILPSFMFNAVAAMLKLWENEHRDPTKTRREPNDLSRGCQS